MVNPLPDGGYAVCAFLPADLPADVPGRTAHHPTDREDDTA